MTTRRRSPKSTRPLADPTSRYWYMSDGLNHAFKDGGEAAIKALLASDGGGINVQDMSGSTPLAWAVQSLALDTVDRLLAAGADVNLPDDRGLPPLLLLFGRRATSSEIAARLVEAGADVSVRDPNTLQTPLHLAAASHDEQAVEALLGHGAAVQAVDKNGRTPLHDVTRASNVGWQKRDLLIVRALLNAGADVNAKTHHSEFALAGAVQSGCWEVADLLVSVGAGIDIPCGTDRLVERVAPDRWSRWEQAVLNASMSSVSPQASRPRARL